MNSAQQHGVDAERRAEAEQSQQKIERNHGSLGSGLAYILCGYPGAGKTTAAERMQEALQKVANSTTKLISLDDLEATDGVDRTETGTFLTAVVENAEIETCNFVIFDSVYSLEEMVYLSNYFDKLGIIYIRANHAARHNRLIERAKREKKDLGNFSHDMLRYRDIEAESAGLNVIEETEFYDCIIENVGISESQFEQYAKYVLQEIYLDYKHGEY